MSVKQWVGAQNNDFTIPLSEVGKRGTLSIDNKMGPITIKGTNRQDVYVKYTNQEEKDDDNKMTAKSGMKRISGGAAGLEAGEQNNKVYVQTENWSKKIDMYVRANAPNFFILSKQGFMK